LNALEKTRQTLARTRNQAVLPVLAAGLRSTSADVRAAAIRATMQRLDVESHTQLIRHFAELCEADRTILAEAHRAMPHHAAPALKAAVLGPDARLCDNACQMILLCHDFNSVPALLKAVESVHRPRANQIVATILQLAGVLHDNLNHSTVDRERSGHDPAFVRHQVLAALDRFLAHDAKQPPVQIIEAFLLLAPSDHVTLHRMLSDSEHRCHAPLVAILSSNEDPPVFERLSALLRETDAPAAALEAIARRTDRPFVEFLFETLRRSVPLRTLHNMERLCSVAWLESHREMLLDLDGRSQAVAIELAAASNMKKKRSSNFWCCSCAKAWRKGAGPPVRP
jgi:hypothetical protein